MFADHSSELSLPWRGRSEAVQLLHNIKLYAGMLLEGENQSNSKNQRHHIIFLAKEAENICGCRPWNIPSEDGSTMCWIVGSVCFHQVFLVQCQFSFSPDLFAKDHDQVMEKIRSKKLEPVCDCKKDCVRWVCFLYTCEWGEFDFLYSYVWFHKILPISNKHHTDRVTHWAYRIESYVNDWAPNIG